MLVWPHPLDVSCFRLSPLIRFIHPPTIWIFILHSESGVHWCLRVVLNLISEISSVALPAQLVIYVFLKDKLKNLDIPENTKPGPGEVECGYLDELAEGKRTPMLEQRCLMIEMHLVVTMKSLEK